MQLEADDAGIYLFPQRVRQADVALAEKTDIHGKRIRRLQHVVDMPWAGSAGGGECTGRRPRASAEHGGNAGHQSFFDLLRADEVDVGINAASGNNHTFACDNFRACADGNGHAGLDIRIARFAYRPNFAVFKPYVGLDDTPMVYDQRIGNHRVRHFCGNKLTLPHAIADDFAAAEFDFFAVNGEIFFHLYP